MAKNVVAFPADEKASSTSRSFAQRWGGEEFLVIAEIPDPARMVEKVQAAKDDLAFRKLRLRETDEPMNPITFSALTLS